MIAPTAISDVELARSVAVVSCSAADAAAIGGSLRARVAVGTIDASAHIAAPASPASAGGAAGARGGRELVLASARGTLGAVGALVNVVPRLAALLQRVVIQRVPGLASFAPPPVHVPVLGDVCPPRGAHATASCVALHPHRRVLAVASANEGASQHGAVVVYDLAASLDRPVQVLRSVLLRGLRGVAWKPGSRDVLVAYGEAGVTLFQLGVDPRTGALATPDAPSAKATAFGAGLSRRLVLGDAVPRPLLPAAGAVPGANDNLGVGCLYPVPWQLSRFGIAPPVDVVAALPDTGRLLACGSSASSGVRVVDVSFSPLEQLFAAWNAPAAAAAGSARMACGTFVGSAHGGTADLAWLPAAPSSATALLLRAVRHVALVEVFAAGASAPVALLDAPAPVTQLVVASWPVLDVAARNAAAPDVQPAPDRHVPVWLLFERAEGAVLYALALNEARVHDDARVTCTPLIRLCTTVVSPAPSLSPVGGRVRRLAIVRETAARDSGTVVLSLESGHVVAVKLSRTAQTGGAAFVAQTTVVASTAGDDDDDGARAPHEAELVGAFGSSTLAVGTADFFSVVTWRPRESVARLLCVHGTRCEKSPVD